MQIHFQAQLPQPPTGILYHVGQSSSCQGNAPHRTWHHGLCSVFGLEPHFDTLPARGDKTEKSCFFPVTTQPRLCVRNLIKGSERLRISLSSSNWCLIVWRCLQRSKPNRNKRSLDLFGEQTSPFNYCTGDLCEGWTSQPAQLMWAGSGVHTLISTGMTVVDVLQAVLVPSTAHRDVRITVKIHCQSLSISGLLLRSFLFLASNSLYAIGFINLIYGWREGIHNG